MCAGEQDMMHEYVRQGESSVSKKLNIVFMYNLFIGKLTKIMLPTVWVIEFSRYFMQISKPMHNNLYELDMLMNTLYVD